MTETKQKRMKAGNCFWCDQVLYHPTRDHPHQRWHISEQHKAVCYECVLKLSAFVLDRLQRERRLAESEDQIIERVMSLEMELLELKARPLFAVNVSESR